MTRRPRKTDWTGFRVVAKLKDGTTIRKIVPDSELGAFVRAHPNVEIDVEDAKLPRSSTAIQ